MEEWTSKTCPKNIEKQSEDCWASKIQKMTLPELIELLHEVADEIEGRLLEIAQ